MGDGVDRIWDDCRRLGFIGAGQGRRWRDAICGFQPGDIFAAYVRGHGFVGIGRIREKARMAREILIGKRPLLAICPNMSANSDSTDLSEYVALVDWIQHVPKKGAKMKRKSGIYTTTHVRASLDGQPKTVEFLEEAFRVKFREILS